MESLAPVSLVLNSLTPARVNKSVLLKIRLLVPYSQRMDCKLACFLLGGVRSYKSSFMSCKCF